MKDSASEILVLPSWYPNKLNTLTGDFIQRHVKAIAIYRHQTVIFVIKDPGARFTKDVKVEESYQHNLTERLIYYHPRRTGFAMLDAILSQRKYNRIYKSEIKQYIQKKGKPILVHVHVALKAGLLALWVKRKWQIPFVLSEHWSGYFDESDYKISDLAKIYQFSLKKIFREAYSVTVVSDKLGKAIVAKELVSTYRRIPNVVDTDIFFPGKKQHADQAIFIHASTMNYPKNMMAIFEAFKLLSDRHNKFILNLFGPTDESLQKTVKEMGLQNQVHFKGEVSQVVLADAMRSSDALILYSRFETFGCVIIEANAAGIPVIVSDIPVFHELIEHNENGVIVPGDNPQALASKLQEFISGQIHFNSATITESAEKFNFKMIGLQFEELYDVILNKVQG